MSAIELGFSFLLTLALHATVLLGAAWLLERTGALKHPGWAELAWRTALFGALLSASLEFVPLPGDGSHANAGIGVGTGAGMDTGTGSAVAPSSTSAGMGVAGLAAEPPPLASPESPARVPSLATAAARAGVEVPDLAAWLLTGLWLAGLLWCALRLIVQVVGVHRLGRAAKRHGAEAGPGLSRAARALADELAIAPPRLCLLPQLQSPMVLPGANVLLPPWSETLPSPQQRAMLAHELSHLQRRDPAWRIAQRVAALPLFFHPLARHANRRLDALAEDACDARAAQLLGSGRPLAECLATCLSHAGARAGQPALAVAMAGDAGAVVRRVRNLLENTTMSLRPLSPRLRRTALALAVVAIVALPGLAITTVASEGFGDRIMSRLELDGRQNHSYRSRSLTGEESLRLSGDVTLNDTDTNVVHLGKGARLEVDQTRDGVRRQLHVFGKDGVIQRRYWRNGDERPFDDEARQWLAAALPAMVRNSGINADARGKRILQRGGANALMADIAQMQTDHARASYLRVLYANATLDQAQLQQSLEIARDIDSDFELRRALQSALSSKRLAPGHREQLLGLAGEFSSDFELAELLMAIADEVPASGPAQDAWQQALSRISSDFEHRRVLEALLARPGITPGGVQVVLESAAQLGSDFELRSLLEKTARHAGGHPAVLATYMARTGELSSDFESRQALSALIQAGPVDVATANAVLDAVGGVSSDFEAGEVLRELAARMPADQTLVNRYRAAARGLGDHERGQAEKALDRFAIAG